VVAQVQNCVESKEGEYLWNGCVNVFCVVVCLLIDLAWFGLSVIFARLGW
jgi:hypothetical protein